jgi:demethylspheroidene O-methyltransferase
LTELSHDGVSPRPAPSPSISWRDRWRAFRNRCVSNPKFQRRAALFPLTRATSLRRARDLFDVTAGFVYSQILFACVKLDLFHKVGLEHLSIEEIAARLDLPVESAERLVRAAATLRLTEKRDDGLWMLGDLGAAMLGAAGVAEMVEHHHALYEDLHDPVALLRNRGGRVGEFWAYSRNAAAGELTAEKVADYSALMAASQATFVEDVIAAYPFRKHARLVDVGGGEGQFIRAVAKVAPSLSLAVFDLPGVAALARERFAEDGLAERAEAVGGDFFADTLPTADLYSLIRVCFDHDDAPAVAILRNIRQSMRPGATLLVAETMAGTPGAEPVGDAYFGFYLLAMGSGRPRTAEELSELLRAAGFTRIKEARTARPMLVRVLVAQTG